MNIKNIIWNVQVSNNLIKRGKEKSCWPKWLWKWAESLRLKAKDTTHRHCTLVDEVISHGMWANNVDITGIEKISKWMASGGRQASHCACVHAKLLQLCLTLCEPMDYSPQASPLEEGMESHWEFTGKPRRRLEWCIWCWVRDGDTSMNFCLAKYGCQLLHTEVYV